MSKNLNEEIMKFFACYGRQCDEITLLAWHEVLEKYPLQEVCTAMDQLKRSVDQFPTTGKLCDIIEHESSNNKYEDEKSWINILEYSRGKDIFLLTSEMEAVKMMGGFRMIENAKDDQLLFLKKEFQRCLKIVQKMMLGLSDSKMFLENKNKALAV